MKAAINAASAKMGGAVSYLTNLLLHLPPPQSGNRFFVFLPADTAKLLPNVRGNIKLFVLPRKDTGGWRRLWWEQVTLRRFLRSEGIDALFSTANFAMLRCPVKQVLLVRNALYFSKMYKQMFLGKHKLRYRLTFALRRWMILQSVRSADMVMTPTQVMLDELARFVKLDRRKALVNYYGADMLSCPSPPWGRGWSAAGASSSSSAGGAGEGVPPMPLAVDSNAGHETCAAYAAAQPGVIRLTYVSLYSEHKNLSTLLRAMPLLNRNGAGKFVLKTTVDPAWEGAAWTVTHKDDLALARQPEVAPWVEFSGPPQTEQVEQLYRQCDVFVFPSLCESFGHPMVEAMVHGLPIVASDTPANREICGEAAIYFSPLRPEDAARQIARVAADDDLRAKLSAEGQRRAETQFNWTDHVRGLLDALESKAGPRYPM
jgi:glycosyltransferase involved in cell wall biosynthesis